MGLMQKHLTQKQTAKSKRLKRVLRALVVVILIWPPVSWLAAKSLIVRSEVPRADALVVLGGSSTYLERTRRAAEIFREGRASKVILTNDGQKGGWSEEDQRNLFFVERAKQELELAGVPSEKIEILPQIVSSTYDEAQLLHEYVTAHQVKSLLIVTSAYHSRRAMWTLRHALAGNGITIGSEPASTGQQTPSPLFWWIQPQGWRMVAGEYIKLIYYRVKYY